MLSVWPLILATSAAMGLQAEAPKPRRTVLVLEIEGVATRVGERMRRAVVKAFGEADDLEAVTLASAKKRFEALSACDGVSCIIAGGAKAGLDSVVVGRISPLGDKTVLLMKWLDLHELAFQPRTYELIWESPKPRDLIAAARRCADRLVSLHAAPSTAAPEPFWLFTSFKPQAPEDEVLREMALTHAARAGRYHPVGVSDTLARIGARRCLDASCLPPELGAHTMRYVVQVTAIRFSQYLVIHYRLDDRSTGARVAEGKATGEIDKPATLFDQVFADLLKQLPGREKDAISQ